MGDGLRDAVLGMPADPDDPGPGEAMAAPPPAKSPPPPPPSTTPTWPAALLVRSADGHPDGAGPGEAALAPYPDGAGSAAA
eukprot:15459919-Alexandrium_andersonii.AAC.1